MVWVQFAKSPEIGQVKTRLAASVGDTKALDAHLTLSFAVNCQLRAIESTCPPSGLRSEQHHIRLAVAGSRGLEWSLDRLKDKGLSFDSAVMQQGLTLGDRMSRELSAALAHADYAFIVGSDFPVLDTQYLRSALTMLAEHDVVIGPAIDGGFGLIGLRHCNFKGFDSVSWGTGRALNETLVGLEQQGLRVGQLPVRYDVDELEDWEHWKKSTYYKALFST